MAGSLSDEVGSGGAPVGRGRARGAGLAARLRGGGAMALGRALASRRHLLVVGCRGAALARSEAAFEKLREVDHLGPARRALRLRSRLPVAHGLLLDHLEQVVAI